MEVYMFIIPAIMVFCVVSFFIVTCLNSASKERGGVMNSDLREGAVVLKVTNASSFKVDDKVVISVLSQYCKDKRFTILDLDTQNNTIVVSITKEEMNYIQPLISEGYEFTITL